MIWTTNKKQHSSKNIQEIKKTLHKLQINYYLAYSKKSNRLHHMYPCLTALWSWLVNPYNIKQSTDWLIKQIIEKKLEILF